VGAELSVFAGSPLAAQFVDTGTGSFVAPVYGAGIRIVARDFSPSALAIFEAAVVIRAGVGIITFAINSELHKPASLWCALVDRAGIPVIAVVIDFAGRTNLRIAFPPRLSKFRRWLTDRVLRALQRTGGQDDQCQQREMP